MTKSFKFLQNASGLLRSERRREVRRLTTAGNQANVLRSWSEAGAAYAAALEIDPTLGAIWVQYGHALKEQGFLQQSEHAYRRAIALNESLADTYLQLGHVLKLQGHLDAAGSAYRDAYLYDPTSPHSRVELAALGGDLPDTQAIAAFRGHATETVISGRLDTAAPLSLLPDVRHNHNFAPDSRFVKALYGEAYKSKVIKDTRGGGSYVSIPHLMKVHGLEADFLDLFHVEFYFYTNKCVQDTVRIADRDKCVVHFCEAGVDALLTFNEKYAFDPEFYRNTYLSKMPFTPGNSYRHWINHGLRQNWAPNRSAWIRTFFDKAIQNVDALDITLCTAVVDNDVNKHGWTAQFEHFVNVGAFDPRAPILIDETTVGALVAIADRQANQGTEQLAFALYQRILQHLPFHQQTLHRYADGLLRRNCLLEAGRIYQLLVDNKPKPSIWVFINLARCNQEFGLHIEALTTLRQGIDAFPGDVGLRQKLIDAAAAFSSREWETAFAEGRLGRFEQAQARLGNASKMLSALLRARETLPTRPIRSIALMANQDLPQCRFYRVEQKVEQLEHSGYEVGLYDFHNDIPRFLSEIYKYEAVIFYRVPALYDVIVAIEKAKELGIVTIYEIDDLIFDAAAYPASFESYGGQVEMDQYIGLNLGVPLFEHAMTLCDFGLASTPSLAGQMRKRVATQQAYVHRNAFGRMHETYAAREPEVRSNTRVTIFYGSGTKAHKEDFQELVEPALVEMVHRHGDRVAIVLMGYITMTARLRSIEANITLVAPNWNIEQYWAILSQVDINIAVLKPSLMADCKSEIKWLEAALFAIPSVVSDTATFREVIEPGVTGLICATASEWTAALGQLVSNGDLRRRIGQQARQKALSTYNVQSMADNLTHIFREAAPVVSGPEKPTIVIVNVFYPPQAIGGATRVVHDNVRHLAQAYGDRFRIEVFTSIEGGREPYQLSSYTQDGVRVTGVTTPAEVEIDRKPIDDQMRMIFGRFLDRVAPALVHFHCIQRLTPSVVLAALERRVPYLVSAHDGWWISDAQFLLDAEGRIALYDYADPVATLQSLGQIAFNRLMQLRRPLMGAARVLGVSAPFAEIYRACGVPNVLSIPNGISALPQPERVASTDGQVRLGFIGGMAPHKGYNLLKYALYSHPFSHLRLLVIDHSMQAGELRQEVWGTTRVEFRPKRSQSEIGLLYSEIDVLLAPSVWPESYGLVTREALHSGCWVVASDRGSIGEYVVDGRNGFIVDVSNPAGLVDALKQIDRDPQRYLISPAERPAMRQASEQGDDLAKLYQSIISGSAVASDRQSAA